MLVVISEILPLIEMLVNGFIILSQARDIFHMARDISNHARDNFYNVKEILHIARDITLVVMIFDLQLLNDLPL